MVFDLEKRMLKDYCKYGRFCITVHCKSSEKAQLFVVMRNKLSFCMEGHS